MSARSSNAPRGPVAAALRFARSVPGQVLFNTAAFKLPEELRMRADWRVLEIACGRASFTRLLAARAGLERPPVGVDSERAQLARARRDMAVEGGPGASLVQGERAVLPFRGESFELVLFSHAFRQLDDDALRLVLSEARRVVKIGALCVAWEYAPTSSGRLDRWNRWLLARDTREVRLRTFEELRDLAYASGFDWVEPARLRPFLLPPIPRVSLIMGKAPVGWERRVIDGKTVLQYATEQSPGQAEEG